MSSFFLSRLAPMPLTLPPAQKAVPAPVIRSAPTSGFSPQVLIIVRSAGVRLSDRALRTSGRFSVMTATRSRITQSSSSVPVSMVISVLVMWNAPAFLVLSVIPGRCEASNPESRDSGLALRAPRNDGSINSPLEFLHPGPQFQLPGPGAARLLQHVPVIQGNGVGIEHRIRPVGLLAARRAANAAVDHEMRDVNSLRG